MRILLVSPYFPPLHASASLRVHGFAAAWSRRGEDVTVLTTRKHAGQQGLDRDCTGFTVVELPYRVPRFVERVRMAGRSGNDDTPPPRRGPLATLHSVKERTGIFSVRMPDFTRSWIRPAVAWCRRHGPWDCVVSSYGPYTAHLVALAVRRAGLASRWVADFRDLWTQNPLCAGLFPFTLRERALERACFRSADLLVTVSEGLAAALRSATDTPVEVVYNGYDPADAFALPPERSLTDARTNLVFTGRVYPRGQRVAPLFSALARLRTRRPELAERLRVVVAGDHAEPWRAAAEQTGTADLLELRGRVEHADALRLQRDADALVMFEFDDPDQGQLSGKIFEYLRATPPILVLNGGPEAPIASLVHRTGRGIALGEHPDRIADALERLVTEGIDVTPRPDALRCYSRVTQAERLLEFMAAGCIPAPLG